MFPIGNKPHKMKRRLLWRFLSLGVGGQLQSGNKKKGVKTPKLLGLEKKEGKREMGSLLKSASCPGLWEAKTKFPILSSTSFESASLPDFREKMVTEEYVAPKCRSRAVLAGTELLW